jgi:hypothetical protein
MEGSIKINLRNGMRECELNYSTQIRVERRAHAGKKINLLFP